MAYAKLKIEGGHSPGSRGRWTSRSFAKLSARKRRRTNDKTEISHQIRGHNG